MTRAGVQIKIYQRLSGLLAFQGAIKGEDRMSGVVGPDVLASGSWVGTRR